MVFTVNIKVTSPCQSKLKTRNYLINDVRYSSGIALKTIIEI